MISTGISTEAGYAWGLSPDKTCEVGPITEGKNGYYCIYCSDMLKIYQRETKLFDLSPDTYELNVKKTTSLRNGFVLMVLLQWVSLQSFLLISFASAYKQS